MKINNRFSGLFCASGLQASLLVVLLSTQGTLHAESSIDIESQRELFKYARDQLDDGKFDEFESSLKTLAAYPLHDYLWSQQLQKQWSDRTPTKSDVAALNRFEKATGDESLTRRLTRNLQKRLAETESWPLFLGVSKSRVASKMPCTTLRAKFELGQINGFTEDAVELWVEPKKHPDVCRVVLEDIESKHTPPVPAIWERVYQSMEANKPRYAEEMLGYLGTRDREQVQRWIDAEAQPETLLKSGKLAENTVLNRRVVADLIVDWSRQDTPAAVEHWLTIRDDYTFNADRFYDTHRAIVMRGAYRRLPQAQGWLAATNEQDDDLELMEWRVRTALLAEDWPAVLDTIARLPVEEQEEDHWAYWVARAMEQTGQADEARALFTEVAQLQSYYGFLAADRLELDYAIYDEPIVPAPALIASLRKDPSLLRAREFNQVGLEHESRREWNNWLAEHESEEIAASAVLAGEWGLYDRAIYSAGKSGDEQRRAITLRFPVLYRSEVAKASAEHRIDPAWVFGVMRRESAYIRDIRSSAGAIGLMQLMPRTASYVARLQGKEDWRGDLTDATTNISFGTHYLRYVMNKFDDHQVLATASYNAGPHRVDQWLRDSETDSDVWIDTIPFTETRRYVRAVMAYAAIYEFQLNGKPQRLSTKLRTVPAAPST